MSVLRKILTLAVLIISLSVWSATSRNDDVDSILPDTYVEATVTGVWDGDTLHVDLDGSDVKVRLIGMDCPEIGEHSEPLGEEAEMRARALADNRTVWLESDAGDLDKYGRALRYVWLEIPKNDSKEEASSKMLNAILLSEGLAAVMTVPPNTHWAEQFEEIESKARSSGLGIWRQ